MDVSDSPFFVLHLHDQFLLRETAYAAFFATQSRQINSLKSQSSGDRLIQGDRLSLVESALKRWVVQCVNETVQTEGFTKVGRCAWIGAMYQSFSLLSQ